MLKYLKGMGQIPKNYYRSRIIPKVEAEYVFIVI